MLVFRRNCPCSGFYVHYSRCCNFSRFMSCSLVSLFHLLIRPSFTVAVMNSLVSMYWLRLCSSMWTVCSIVINSLPSFFPTDVQSIDVGSGMQTSVFLSSFWFFCPFLRIRPSSGWHFQLSIALRMMLEMHVITRGHPRAINTWMPTCWLHWWYCLHSALSGVHVLLVWSTPSKFRSSVPRAWSGQPPVLRDTCVLLSTSWITCAPVS